MITLLLPGATARFPIPATLTAGILPEHPLPVLDARIGEDGFRFLVGESQAPLGWLRYNPERFADFLDDWEMNGTPRAAIFASDLALSTYGLRQYNEWADRQTAAAFIHDIQAGHLTFEEAKKIRPTAFNVPELQKFLAQSFATDQMPRRRPGKRRKPRPEVVELYALACRIYRESPGMSWEYACHLSTAQRPDLVPPEWQKDPDGNLKREAARYLDKSPYSQLSYRESRDK